MMRIAICDDDVIQKQQIEKLLYDYTKDYPMKACFIKAYQSPFDLLADIESKGAYDVYLLDVIMPKINGIELGEKIREMDKTGYIIYQTVERDYAIQAYDVQAYHYLLKPVDYEKLCIVLDDLYQKINADHSKTFLVKTSEGVSKVNLDDINYVELMRRRCHYHLTNGEEVISLAIRTNFAEETAEVLEDDRFYMCGSSYILNLYQVSAIRENKVFFKNGHTMVPPKKYFSTIRSKWLDYWLED